MVTIIPLGKICIIPPQDSPTGRGKTSEAPPPWGPDRFGGGLRLQERRERHQVCNELLVCLDREEARNVTGDGLDTCGE
ncbi:hypothetical protein E2C01_027907 [Portunus trituberculatus]|uniref:Uncharacterized protein n=1 Tax=Portunus trituberculatus TaxID=210409 RepID=A0A5B7EM63_PORTR|nr:hypothetical protein [Portunus trituberculatus]